MTKPSTSLHSNSLPLLPTQQLLLRGTDHDRIGRYLWRVSYGDPKGTVDATGPVLRAVQWSSWPTRSGAVVLEGSATGCENVTLPIPKAFTSVSFLTTFLPFRSTYLPLSALNIVY